MAEYKTRLALVGMDTAVHHVVALPACCPKTGNPLAGSTIRVSYRPRGVVLPVEQLNDMASEYIGGHEDVREMETMIQHMATRMADVVGASVRVRADLIIRPPYGGDNQRMVVSVRCAP